MKVVVVGARIPRLSAETIARLISAGYDVIEGESADRPRITPPLVVTMEDISPFSRSERKGKGDKARQRSEWNRNAKGKR